MPKGIYDRTKSKFNSGGFQKGNKINVGKHPKTEFKEGQNNLRWKGGRHKQNGYILIKKRNHPFCNCEGYIFEHRLVVEKQIGRYLLLSEKCHHLGERDDNRPHMLIAFVNSSAHMRFHYNPLNVKPSEIIFDGRKLH